jgi:hypothetical protein
MKYYGFAYAFSRLQAARWRGTATAHSSAISSLRQSFGFGFVSGSLHSGRSGSGEDAQSGPESGEDYIGLLWSWPSFTFERRGFVLRCVGCAVDPLIAFDVAELL